MTVFKYTSMYIVMYIGLNFKNPNHPKSSKGHLFGTKSALLETGTFTSSNGGKMTTWQEVQAISAWIWKINENAWCILMIRACLQKCTGGLWRIQEGS